MTEDDTTPTEPRRPWPGDQPWHAHGNDAPSRGPERVDDGMAESGSGDDTLTAPDGEVIDPDVSDGGESGQDSGSMS